jgi:tripartite-type tricarboxylate transporter receptor subunit TctC
MKALILVLGIFLFGTANAQYPNKPLRLIVPFAPGGSTDIFARLLAERAQGPLGQPVVVENRAGAAGNLGANEVVKAAPDGYTLLMATTGVMAINNSLYKNMTYDAAKDLEPVLFVASITNVLIVPPDSPAKNVSDLVAIAKKEPGKLSFASSGAGSSTHMSAELFKSMSGTDILHIPYKGSGQAMPDLMSGRVNMMFENAPGAVSHIKAGKLRALAQTGLKRSPALPDVPTVDESGVKGYESLSWSGIAVAAGTPKPVIERLNKDLNAVLNMPEIRQKIEEQGAEVVGGSPEAFRKHVETERAKWSRLIKQNNIVVN